MYLRGHVEFSNQGDQINSENKNCRIKPLSENFSSPQKVIAPIEKFFSFWVPMKN